MFAVEPKESDVEQLALDISKHLTLCVEKRIQIKEKYDDMHTEIAKLEAEIKTETTNTDRGRDQMKAKIIGLLQNVSKCSISIIFD